jgi:hypothetical protein
MAWMTRMSPRRVMTSSPPGRSCCASTAMSRSVLCIHSCCGSPPTSTWMVSGSASTSLRAAGWSNRTAPQMSVVGSPPPPWRISSYRSLLNSRSRSMTFGAEAPGAPRIRCPRPCGTSASSPGCSGRGAPSSGCSQAGPDVTMWNQMCPGIAGIVMPHGALSSERQ